MISYEYCSSTDGDESYSESDESEIPDKAPVLTPDDVTTMMNNKIDNIKGDIQDRTTELREVQNFVKRIEKYISTELPKRFEQVDSQCDYNKKDLIDHVKKKTDLIGTKFMSGNKAMAVNKEEAEYGDLNIMKKMRVSQREADERFTQVEDNHSVLMGDYDQLLNQNFYFTKIASDVIILQEIMTALLAADEKDKKDISLIGRAKTGGPRESNDTGTQLEQNDQSSNTHVQTNQSQKQISMQRPNTGISRRSGQSMAFHQKYSEKDD